MESNAGWEGGLKAGLAVSTAEYVMFLNDDTMIPSHQKLWLHRLLNHFIHPEFAAIGPTSNCVMGRQNMFLQENFSLVRSKFLIGFCMLLRRSDLDAAGGVDDTMPGGDDLDLSIRLRKLGKYLLIDREVYVHHFGFKTGERLEGTANQENGWNSIKKIERTNHALMRKHGLKAFLDLFASEEPILYPNGTWSDREADICREWAVGEKVADLGCGAKKTSPNFVGLDLIPHGQSIPGLNFDQVSSADVVCNVENDLPIQDFDAIVARHILEHMLDATQAVKSWGKSLKHGGRMVIAVPDHTYNNTIPLNHQHVHAWTPRSLKNFMESLGWKTLSLEDPRNNVSFVGIFEKNGVQ